MFKLKDFYGFSGRVRNKEVLIFFVVVYVASLKKILKNDAVETAAATSLNYKLDYAITINNSV